MAKITNYWLFLFLLGNICMQYQILTPFGNLFFYPLLALGVVSIAINMNTLLAHLNKYKFIGAYIVILWVYQFVFGLSHIHEGTWVYLIAKTTMLMMTVIAIEKIPEYYHSEFCKKFLLFCVVLITAGLAFFDSAGINGRHVFGFGNPNAAGHLAVLTFAGMLMINPFVGKKWLSRGLMLVCLVAVLLTGSRSSAAMAVIAIFIRYGINKKLIIALVVCYMTATLALPSLGIHLIGIERFTESVESGDLISNRESEREAAIFMINENPIEGNGIMCPNSEGANMISELGSHNTYLDWLKWFGIPLASLLILYLVIDVLQIFFRYWKTQDEYIKFHLFVVVSTVLDCFFEGYIWGVNEMSNTIFFTSLAVLCKRKKI
ncbi:O-antigen ligase family protein [Bacteroides congonensis]|uniref:O-antigen ligase family protein n=1 Tax=Bacteroides congonensis TaxID=1871006 RepID=UPI003A848D63